MYSEQAQALKIDEYRMQLAIATNPHASEKQQGKLWSVLQPRREIEPREERSEEDRKRILEQEIGRAHV